VCDPAATQRFVARTRGAEVVVLPKVGHGFSAPRNWMPQFRQAFTKLVSAPDATEPAAPAVQSLGDLPLVEVPARGPTRGLLAVHLTGDGGYGVTDRGIAKSLAAQGVPVVVLNSLRYFWTARTPDGAAADLARILRHYLTAWSADKFVIIGYSFGADVTPFMLNRLPDDLRARLRSVALLGPSPGAEFQFHVGDWLDRGPAKTPYAVLPELERLRGTRIVCFYGSDDKDTIARKLDPSFATVYELPGGHRFGRHYQFVADKIVEETR
jgi:type IV secretory pathway VirJ component